MFARDAITHCAPTQQGRSVPVVSVPFLSFGRLLRTAAALCGLTAALTAAPAFAQDADTADKAKATTIANPTSALGQNKEVEPLYRSIPGFLQSPYGPPSFGPPYGTTHWLGDWGGIQPWLQKHGLWVAADLYEDLAGNVSGGKQRAYADAGQFGVTVDADLHKLFNAGDWADDLWLHTLVVNGHGTNVARLYGDNGNQAQQIYGARGNVVAHMVWAYFEKSWLHHHIDWSVGFIPTGTFFNNSPWQCSFMNVWMCGNVTPTKYLVGGRDWPSGNIGTVLRVMPTNHFYIMGGLFAVSPHSYNGGISGWAWAQDGLGKLSTEVEAGWIPEFGRDHLIGHYKIGVMYDNSRYKNLYEDATGGSYVLNGTSPKYESGQTSVWFLADQMLIRHGKGPMNGLMLMGGWAYASGQTSQIKNHLFGGFMDTGYAWGRPLDTVGFMAQWAEFSRSAILNQEAEASKGLPLTGYNFGAPYGIQGHQTIYEAFYMFHVMNGMTLQPDFQYINHVGGTTVFKDAVVLSLAFNVSL